MFCCRFPSPLCKLHTRIPAIEDDLQLLTSASGKAKAFNNYFASQCNAPHDQSLKDEHALPRVNTTINYFTISEEETLAVPN